MSVELIHASIAFAYLAVWVLIRQTTARRRAEPATHPPTRRAP